MAQQQKERDSMAQTNLKGMARASLFRLLRENPIIGDGFTGRHPFLPVLQSIV